MGGRRKRGGGMMFDRGSSEMTDAFQPADDDALPTEAVSVDDVRAAMEAARADEFDLGSEETTVRGQAAEDPGAGPTIIPVGSDMPLDHSLDAPTFTLPQEMLPDAKPVQPVAPQRVIRPKKTRNRIMMVFGVVLILVAVTLVVVAQSMTQKPKPSIMIEPSTK